MANNKVGYGLAQIAGAPFTTGNVFVVTAVAGVNYNNIVSTWTQDSVGVLRQFTTISAALASCAPYNGDVIILAPDFNTPPTASELDTAIKRNVSIRLAGNSLGGSTIFVGRQTNTLPQSVAASIFTVTGRILVRTITGTVTVAIQNQTNNTKLTATPMLVGLSPTDLCAVASIANLAVGATLSVTGTLATAMVTSSAGARIYEATPLVVEAGTIDLNCAASNTGSVRWSVVYEPLEPGAAMFAN